jgi:hypothetical protein
MKSNNDKKWTVADVLTNFGKNQAQVQQEKQLKQQLKEALMQNQAQALGQFVPGMEQQIPFAPQDMSLDQSYEQAKQGGIHIDPSKKGTFKAQATRMGMGIQEAAEHILSNKDSYSSGMVRKANFARNFAKEEGGQMMQYGAGGKMMACPEGLYWDGQRCVEIPKQISDRNMQTYFTNPPSYGVTDNSGNSLYDGSDIERAKGYYARGSEYGIIPPEGTPRPTLPNPVDMLRQLNEQHSDVLKNTKLNKLQISEKEVDEKWNRLNHQIEKENGGQILDEYGRSGSYSQRGLWDNIRDNAGSGKEPTREMIEQERKIRKKAMGGMMGPSDCDEGFTWNDTYQTCVPVGQEIIDPRTGENYLKDWYSKRLNVINNPGYAEAVGAENVKGQTKFLNQVVPLAKEQLDNYVPTEYVDEIEGMPNATGEYVDYDRETPVINIKRSSVTNPIDFAATQVHEGSTYANQKAWDKFLTPTQNRIIEQNTKPWETFLKDNTTIDKSNKNAVRELEDAYNYSVDPQQDNVHSNVHATRYLFNLLPDEIITEDKIKSMIEEGKQKGYLDRSSPNYHDDFYRLLKLSRDNKSLVNLFNLLASDDTGLSDNDLQMAKYGGNIGNLRKFF